MSHQSRPGHLAAAKDAEKSAARKSAADKATAEGRPRQDDPEKNDTPQRSASQRSASHGSGPQSHSPRRRGRLAHAHNFGPGFVIKLVIMAIVNALGIYVILQAWAVDSYVVLGGMVALLVGANYVYFSKRALPLKYIAPGLAFLLVYQVFTIGYTGYIAFTNYGQGHNSTKDH